MMKRTVLCALVAVMFAGLAVQLLSAKPPACCTEDTASDCKGGCAAFKDVATGNTYYIQLPQGNFIYHCISTEQSFSCSDPRSACFSPIGTFVIHSNSTCTNRIGVITNPVIDDNQCDPGTPDDTCD